MTKTDLLALADRCEREEPSRNLNWSIWNAISPDGPWYVLHDDVITCDKHGPGAAGNPVVTLDDFTGSLDAAVTLVPEGLLWQTGAWHDNHRARVGQEQTRNATFIKTPALALCAAALRARAASHK